MSVDRISFDSKSRFFAFGGQFGYDGGVSVDKGIAYVHEPESSDAKYHRLTANVIGKIIATALTNGATKIKFENVTVTVNYLVQMLGFVGKHGWFRDELSTSEDHAFDANCPTPGDFVGAAQKLRAEAAELTEYARLARCAYQEGEASNAESRATELKATARRMLTQQ